MRGENRKLYNIMLPFWLLVWFPSWLWLLLIPLNYGIDFLVTWLCTKDIPDRGAFCRKHVWKICLAGFVADLAGAAIMLIISFTAITEINWVEDIVGGIEMNPFTHPISLIIVVLVIILVACLIFLIDRKLLTRAGLTTEKARYVALRLAIFTAPYLFLVPSVLFYTL